AKAGCRYVAGVGSAEDVFKIHKAAGGKFRGADAERERRRFRLFLRRWWSIRNRTGRCGGADAPGAQCRIHDAWRHVAGFGSYILLAGQLLLQLLDLLLLLRYLLLLFGYRFTQLLELVGDIV